jgi:hypothetical protein
MNHECTELERRLASGEPPSASSREHARACPGCAATLSIPGRIERHRLSRSIAPGPGFASRVFAAAVDRPPRRHRAAIYAGLAAAAAAAIAAIAWRATAVDVAAIDRAEDLTAERPGQAPEPVDLDLDLAALSDSRGLSMDWRRVGGALARFELGSMKALSRAQKSAVQTALDRANRETFDIRAELGRLELELRRELQKDPPSWPAIDALLGRIGERERALRQARIGAWVRVRRIAAGLAAGLAAEKGRPAKVCDEITCLVDPQAACCPKKRAEPRRDALPVSPSKADIRAAMGRISPDVKRCDPRGVTKISVRVVVRPSGRASAEVTGPAPAELRACVRRALSRARFPRTREGKRFTYGYTFEDLKNPFE